ncbi:hydrogenase maturation nickel metallochaperone HypA/HybF [Candidatus Bipolaricaulota sp. J31]
MHEYSLALSILESLRARLRESPIAHHPSRIIKVHLRQGELLVLSHEALVEAWKLVTEGTELAGSELVIETVPVRVRCPACGYRGDARYLAGEGWHMRVPVLSCPRCGARVEIVEGRDLAVVALTVEEGVETG